MAITVKSTHGLCCPKCRSDEAIKVSIRTWAVLLPEGSEIEGDHEWSYESPAFCQACEYSGMVLDFESNPTQEEKNQNES